MDHRLDVFQGNPRDEVLANRLLDFLMKHSFHSKRAVFRHNLEIIRTLVECWKDCLCVPYRYVSCAAPTLQNNSEVHLILECIAFEDVFSFNCPFSLHAKKNLCISLKLH